MVKWKAEIDIRESWDKTLSGDMAISELVDEIVQHLKRLSKRKIFLEDEELAEFIDQFEELKDSDDEEDEKQEAFDAIWEEFYNWADDDNKLWIRTI